MCGAPRCSRRRRRSTARRPVSLKLECLQHAGSFKARGAFNNLLTRATPEVGCATASGGNHGAAVAYAAARLGVRAKIFVPSISSPAKVAQDPLLWRRSSISRARIISTRRRSCDAYVAASRRAQNPPL